jgi:hypothetical protein
MIDALTAAALRSSLEDLEENDASAFQNGDPATYAEAMRRPQAEQWKKAIQEEYKALLLNDTFEIFESESKAPASETSQQFGFLHKITPIGCKWVFKTKLSGSDNY